MHTPSSEPRTSIFYNYKIYPYERPTELSGGATAQPVVIVGAGPIGMVTAIDLARFGVPTILLEQELQVSYGSRAIVLTRRSLEILQQVGVEKPFVDKGLQWSLGRSYYRGKEVYQMVLPHDEDDRFLPGLNIEQQYIEEFLVDACQSNDLIDFRWGQKVIAVTQNETSVTLRVDTPDGEYDLTTPWVVAADGGRSTIRKILDLRMEGRAYPGNFVIADIKADIALPTERRCYFDPDWNPGNNVLVHRQPDGIWRLDFRLPDGETAEQALEETLLASRIDAILDMLDQKTAWDLDWATVYSANTLTLTDYVHGRVLFTGDAAHLLPIFGVRGANTGLQDCNDMAWKLAFVIKGWSERKILDSYSQERVQAAREICAEGGASTRFMTPPTPGYRAMRDAVLSLSLSETFITDLLHWRTSRPHDYVTSALNSFPDDDKAFASGIAVGSPLRNVKLGENDFLFDRLGAAAGFFLLAFADDGDADQAKIFEAAKQPFPVVRVLIAANPSPSLAGQAEIVIADPAGRFAAKYGAQPGTAYLVRPDFHVCARWLKASADQIRHAFQIAASKT